MIYVHYGAEWLYKYYVDVLNYKDLKKAYRHERLTRLGPIRRSRPGQYGKDVDRAEGRKRVWFVFGMSPNNTRRCSSLSSIVAGTGSTSSKAQESAVLLYDLSTEPTVARLVSREIHPDA